MLRTLLIICGIVGALIGLAMYWQQTEAMTGLIVALGAVLTKLVDKISSTPPSAGPGATGNTGK